VEDVLWLEIRARELGNRAFTDALNLPGMRAAPRHAAITPVIDLCVGSPHPPSPRRKRHAAACALVEQPCAIEPESPPRRRRRSAARPRSYVCGDSQLVDDLHRRRAFREAATVSPAARLSASRLHRT
jgi:hypothetical protein